MGFQRSGVALDYDLPDVPGQGQQQEFTENLDIPGCQEAQKSTIVLQLSKCTFGLNSLIDTQQLAFLRGDSSKQGGAVLGQFPADDQFLLLVRVFVFTACCPARTIAAILASVSGNFKCSFVLAAFRCRANSGHDSTVLTQVYRRKVESAKKKSKHLGKYDTPTELGKKWQMEVKYVPQACYAGRDGEAFYQYTMIDEGSRERFIFPTRSAAASVPWTLSSAPSPTSAMRPKKSRPTMAVSLLILKTLSMYIRWMYSDCQNSLSYSHSHSPSARLSLYRPALPVGRRVFRSKMQFCAGKHSSAFLEKVPSALFRHTVYIRWMYFARP